MPGFVRDEGFGREAEVVAVLGNPIGLHAITLLVVDVEITAAQQACCVVGAAAQREILLCFLASAAWSGLAGAVRRVLDRHRRG
ncbi:hypothetical protein WT80_10175 [Burkholderia stagnalis]|nr:hypothetical protein WT80_10175 [Burkholderia stagnalis]